MDQQQTEAMVCATCGEPARLRCAGCDHVFCVEHLERQFAMGYFYLCAACLAQRNEPPRRKKKRSRSQ